MQRKKRKCTVIFFFMEKGFHQEKKWNWGYVIEINSILNALIIVWLSLVHYSVFGSCIRDAIQRV